MTYTMDIETAEGVRQWPFHLGTIRGTAVEIVLHHLKNNFDEVRTIALRLDGKLVKIYDWRDLED